VRQSNVEVQSIGEIGDLMGIKKKIKEMRRRGRKRKECKGKNP
jgi:hypothetical protein